MIGYKEEHDNYTNNGTLRTHLHMICFNQWDLKHILYVGFIWKRW